MNTARPLLNYYGGKWNLADWIIAHFPEHTTYVEVFGGGLSVFLNKQPSKTEVVNDINDRLFMLYNSLRDFSDHLGVLLELTPFSRCEYIHAKTIQENEIEEARRALVVNWMGISGVVDKEMSSGFRASKSQNQSKPKSFRNYVENFWQFHERIKTAYIEKMHFSDCIKTYDTPETLFYLDPPYLSETRVHKKQYKHEMTREQHIEMLNLAKKIKGKCVISGYSSELYDEVLGWKKFERTSRTQGKGSAVETLWLCPRSANEVKQLGFSDLERMDVNV